MPPLTAMDQSKRAPDWLEGMVREGWPDEKKRIRARLWELLGVWPKVLPDPEPEALAEVDCGSYRRRKIAYTVEEHDRAYGWLLLPKKTRGPCPAVLAHHPSSRGTGKDRVVGLQGYSPGSPPDLDSAYGVDLVEAGFIVLAPDVWGDGERIPASGLCRDTRQFYEKHPDWSYLGKIVWDCMRAVDMLAKMPEVSPERIGMTGHSLGAIATLLTSALDDRIAALAANGSVSCWYEKHQPLHWALDDSKGEINCFIKGIRHLLTPDGWRSIPVQWEEIHALMAPRPFLNIQAGQCPHDEPDAYKDHYEGLCSSSARLYELLGAKARVAYLWTDGGHGLPGEARRAMAEWFRRFL